MPYPYQTTIDSLKARFPTHDVMVELFPEGGQITLRACSQSIYTKQEACVSAAWMIEKGESIDTAIASLEQQLIATHAQPTPNP